MLGCTHLQETGSSVVADGLTAVRKYMYVIISTLCAVIQNVLSMQTANCHECGTVSLIGKR